MYKIMLSKIFFYTFLFIFAQNIFSFQFFNQCPKDTSQ